MNVDSKEAFQNLIPNNHCFGCGPNNKVGLQIKSYWSKPGESICRFEPAPHHMAGAEQVLNGGIICTIIDCHSVCTAVAAGYAATNRMIGTGDEVWFATGSIAVRYLAPAAVDAPVELAARIVTATDKTIKVFCTLASRGVTCAEATVIAVRVSAQWQHGRKSSVSA